MNHPLLSRLAFPYAWLLFSSTVFLHLLALLAFLGQADLTRSAYSVLGPIALGWNMMTLLVFLVLWHLEPHGRNQGV